nr:phosphoribosyltransferase family protein [Nitrosomonas nitrosa]
MSSNLDRLATLIRELAIRSGEQFVLTSGRTSNRYFEMKVATMDPECGHLLAVELGRRIPTPDPDFIVGVPVGGLPLVGKVLEHLYPTRPLRGLVVRSEPKKHGTAKLVEGVRTDAELRGKTAFIIEDVTTTGGSTVKIVKALSGVGVTVSGVLTVVLRDRIAIENLREVGAPLMHIFEESELVG